MASSSGCKLNNNMKPYFIGLHQPQQSSHQHLQVHRGRGHRLHQAIQGHNPKEQGRGHQLQRLRGSNVTTIGRDPDQGGSRVGSQKEKGKATTQLMGMAIRVWVLRGPQGPTLKGHRLKGQFVC